MHKRLCAVLLVAALLAGGIVPYAAAQSDVVLTIAVPDYLADFFTPEMFQPFEAEYGVNVEVVSAGFPYFGSAAVDFDGYLESVGEYVSSADVLMVNVNNISPEATRAGYFLDLAPLANTDPALYPEDFFPAAWQSFQWDGGVWGLPAALDVITLNYNPAAFDEAGLAYPNPQWTLDDMAYAARALTEYDENGETVTPGLQAFGDNALLLLRALMGTGLYDNTTFPETADFSNPALETLLELWLTLEEEGINVMPSGLQVITSGDNPVPMRVEQSLGLAVFSGGGTFESAGTLLPGSVAGLDVTGLALSSGTPYPELAYALARFLTNDPSITGSLFGMQPARQSLMNLDAGDTDEQRPLTAALNLSPEAEALVNDALWNALPMAELRYGDYLNLALGKMREGIDARTALEEAEQVAATNLQAALDRRASTVVEVARPELPSELAPGEVALKFGLQSFMMPMPNQDQWDRLMDEFASATPGIGRVEFDAGFNLNADQFAEQYDCFVLPYNAAPDLDPTTLLNLDPFLDADSSFRRDDFVSGALEAVQRDNRTWALPLVIQPASLSYDIDQFEQAGVPLPAGSWTIDAFTDALHALKPSAADPAPFGPTFTGDYLLMLIAAYGGLPLDSNTDPVTVNFTDPANVDAIRQVLDLARDGYINYQALEMVSGARSISVSLSNDSLPAITSDIIGPGLFVVGEMGEGGEDTTGLTTYPQGTTYIPVSYNMQTGYISANAENPQACYLWLKTIAQHPEVLGQMPARRSQLDDPAVEAAFGANAMAFYRAFSESLDAPNALVISPGAMVLSDASAETVLVQNWLNRAFDRYVLEDADLETELAEAQTLATNFQTCLGELPADASDEDRGVRLVECALMVDPDMQTLFGDGE